MSSRFIFKEDIDVNDSEETNENKEQIKQVHDIEEEVEKKSSEEYPHSTLIDEHESNNEQTKHLLNSLEDSLSCLICYKICEDPYESTCCHKLYCKFCSNQLQYTKCPNCRSNNVIFTENMFAKRLIVSLPTQCTRCNCSTTYGSLRDHIENFCEKRMLRCSKRECLFKGIKEDLYQHVFVEHKQELLNKLDDKWLNEYLNDFDRNIENITDTYTLQNKVNDLGNLASIGENGKYYCGQRTNCSLGCCDGLCGPTNGCNCNNCMKLDCKSRNLPKKHLVNREGIVTKYSQNRFACGRKLRKQNYYEYFICGEYLICNSCEIITQQLHLNIYTLD